MSAMLLINTLIANADGLDFKIHLRSDFNRCGLINAIELLKVNDSDEQMQKQIQVFESHAHSNYLELEAQYENIEAMWDDTKSCFDYVYSSIKDTPIEMCLLSILQHLLIVRDDIHVKYAYFRLIEECVSKIVLHRDGRDPDFDSGSKFVLDVDTLLSE